MFGIIPHLLHHHDIYDTKNYGQFVSDINGYDWYALARYKRQAHEHLQP